MKFTDVERLILANQFEILAKLKGDSSDARLAEQLRDGHEWLYAQAFDWFSPNLPSGEADHVVQILGIYSALRDSYDAMEDKAGIDPHAIRFPGFDGNNEGELLAFSVALRDAGRFVSTVPEHGKNSHHPTTEMYSRIIAKWRELGKPLYPYSRETILALVDARKHPESRES